jgi:hypothetical protein
MSEETKNTVKSEMSDTSKQTILGTKIDCRCTPNNNIGIWLVLFALVINSCTGLLPSMREHRMEENIAIHESDVQRLHKHIYKAQEDLRQLEGRELSNEIAVNQVKSKVTAMDKSLTELVNQHKRKK